MTPHLRAAALLLALSSFACGTAEDRDAATPRADTAQPPATAAPDTTSGAGAPAPSETATVTIRYEHVMTCSRFLGRAGQFFVYRFVDAVNRGDTAVVLDPMAVRIGGPSGAVPVLQVPERGEGDIPPRDTVASDEQVLLERGAPGPPPRGPVPLGYTVPGVEMVRIGANPTYDEGTGCDGYNT